MTFSIFYFSTNETQVSVDIEEKNHIKTEKINLRFKT